MAVARYPARPVVSAIESQNPLHAAVPATNRTGGPDSDSNEYLTIVKQRFEAADPDHDGTLSVKELGSPRGELLLRLIQ